MVLVAIVLARIAANVPSSEYAAASSRESMRSSSEGKGIAFRYANFDEHSNLNTAIQDVENLFFVSIENWNYDWRVRQHKNVIEAAKRTGVEHVQIPFFYALQSTNQDIRCSILPFHLVV